MQTQQKINAQWYIYEMSMILCKMIWTFIIARLAAMMGERAFKVAACFSFYYLIQFVFYIYNRNTSFTNNLLVYLALLISIIIITRHHSKIIKF